MRMTLCSMFTNGPLVGKSLHWLVNKLLGIVRRIGVHRMWVPILNVQEVILFSAICPEPWDNSCIDFIRLFSSHLLCPLEKHTLRGNLVDRWSSLSLVAI